MADNHRIMVRLIIPLINIRITLVIVHGLIKLSPLLMAGVPTLVQPVGDRREFEFVPLLIGTNTSLSKTNKPLQVYQHK